MSFDRVVGAIDTQVTATSDRSQEFPCPRFEKAGRGPMKTLGLLSSLPTPHPSTLRRIREDPPPFFVPRGSI